MASPKWLVRLLFSLYAVFFAVLIYLARLDSVSLGYSTWVVAVLSICDAAVFIGILLFTFELATARIRSLWRYGLPLFVAALLVGLIMDIGCTVDADQVDAQVVEARLHDQQQATTKQDEHPKASVPNYW